MITILPDDNYIKNDLIQKYYADNVFVFSAKDGDEYLGYGAVALCDGYAEILDVETALGMESLEHGIFKSLLNFVERRGVYDCICSIDKPQMLKRLRFKPAEKDEFDKAEISEDAYYVCLKGYFDAHC